MGTKPVSCLRAELFSRAEMVPRRSLAVNLLSLLPILILSRPSLFHVVKTIRFLSNIQLSSLACKDPDDHLMTQRQAFSISWLPPSLDMIALAFKI